MSPDTTTPDRPLLGRTGAVAAAVGAPWLVPLQRIGLLWQRRRQASRPD